MPWLIILIGYLLGAIPTAYIASRLLRGRDIRQLGDENMGAANAYRQLGAISGVTVFLIDAGKGALAIMAAQAIDVSQAIVLLTGAAAVAGHNWPVFLGFRGGRGESTCIGVLLTLVTQPMLILAGPSLTTLIVTKNVILASAVLFVPLPVVSWALGVPVLLTIYSISLPCLVGFTHFLRVRQLATH